MGAGGDFLPLYDSTDHLHFACRKCKIVADALMVRRDDEYDNSPTIYFHLKCSKCKIEGQRKIYLEKKYQFYLTNPEIDELLEYDE